MPEPHGIIARLILEALDAGYDVTIRCRPRDDGKVGQVSLPNDWARRLGMSEDQITAARADAIRNLQKT